MKVLVTGGRGYIGAHVVKKLKQQSHTVCATDRVDHGNDIRRFSDQFFYWDIRQPLPPTADHSYDVVVHCAALISVEESVRCPSDYYLTNTVGSINVCRALTFDKCVFASTGGAFSPSSPYALSKLAAEDVIRELCPANTVLRFFNVAGSGGFRSYNPATHLMRRAAMAARGEIPFISVYGADYDTKDGTCVRDYIHVIDVADAIVRAVEDHPSTKPYECLGSGVSYTVNEVIETMKQVSKIDFKVQNEKRRMGDPAVVEVPFMSHFMTPRHNLADMCADTLRYL